MSHDNANYPEKFLLNLVCFCKLIVALEILTKKIKTKIERIHNCDTLTSVRKPIIDAVQQGSSTMQINGLLTGDSVDIRIE